MKRASVESKVLSLPDEAYNKKGYYNSDGPDGTENVEDDMYDAALEDSFEYYENEEEASGKINQENLEKIIAFRSRLEKKLGQKMINAVELLDKIAA